MRSTGGASFFAFRLPNQAMGLPRQSKVERQKAKVGGPDRRRRQHRGSWTTRTHPSTLDFGLGTWDAGQMLNQGVTQMYLMGKRPMSGGPTRITTLMGSAIMVRKRNATMAYRAGPSLLRVSLVPCFQNQKTTPRA